MKTIQFDDGKIGIVNEPTYEVIVRLDKKGKVYEYVGDLVRCKDCKHYNHEKKWCQHIMSANGDDWFCADGERKETEGEK